ncbi:MAG: VCBS repeat-containing protein [Actinomycetota bacterium]
MIQRAVERARGAGPRRGRTPRLAAALSATLLAASVVAAASPGRGATSWVDLATEPVIAFEDVPRMVPGGDVNGDGRADIVGTRCSAGAGAGVVLVYLGPFERTADGTTRTGGEGFRITGSRPADYACSAAPAGDVNGDGLDDLLVGAPYADNNNRRASGAVYVVFGSASPEDVDLADFDAGLQGSRGFRIGGAQAADYVGKQLAGVKDVNSDGLHDVVVGAARAGSAYVVFGRPGPAPVDLLTFELGIQGPMGYRIDFEPPTIDANLSLAGAGDVNGDRVPDILLGLVPTRLAAGYAYVVYGKADGVAVHVRDLRGKGFRIMGPKRRATAGRAVAGVGDVNGDGLADVVVGAPYLDCCPRGGAYVVFGTRSGAPVQLSDLGRSGFRIRGATKGPRAYYHDEAGSSVARAGDVNGDGLADVLLGAPFADHHRRFDSGSAYVVFGKKGSGAVDLGSLEHRGFRIDGARAQGFAGRHVAGAGDLDGDGLADVLVSASTAGLSYLVWGR